MTSPNSRQKLPRAQLITQQALDVFNRFIHIQASSGIILLLAAAIALGWANSPFAASYQQLWHMDIGFTLAGINVSQPLHFWVNDGLMTFFFLIVGMEVRHEIHAGSLSSLRQASLPIAAALGGIAIPALIFLCFNHTEPQLSGWAIPTATDIAFAIGLLALLGPGIPHNIRVFLLALAIIDDIVAVLIIALFYSNGLDLSALPLMGVAILLVLLLQRMGINSASIYVIPGILLWLGILKLGAHPTLAGVILGLMTPVTPMRRSIHPLKKIARSNRHLTLRQQHDKPPHEWLAPLKQLSRAQRDLLPPVVRIQSLLHPWVAFVIMPVFALANAGIALNGIHLNDTTTALIASGIAIALVLGKPIGIIGISWLTVKAGISQLPHGVTWQGLLLVGLFAGIGFTMSIFIALLAFDSELLLNAAKLGVLAGSIIAGTLGIAWGRYWLKHHQPNTTSAPNL